MPARAGRWPPASYAELGLADAKRYPVASVVLKDDEAALYDLATALYRDRRVSDPVYKAALEKFGERGILDIIGIIGYYDLVSMTLITMQAEPPNDSVKPLPALAK